MPRASYWTVPSVPHLDTYAHSFSQGHRCPLLHCFYFSILIHITNIIPSSIDVYLVATVSTCLELPCSYCRLDTIAFKTPSCELFFLSSRRPIDCWLRLEALVISRATGASTFTEQPIVFLFFFPSLVTLRFCCASSASSRS